MGWTISDAYGNTKLGSTGFTYPTRTVSATTSLASTDHLVLLDTTGATTAPSTAYTVTLPSATTAVGMEIIILDKNGNANNRPILVAVASGEILNDVTNGSYTIDAQREQVTIVSSGSRWYLI